MKDLQVTCVDEKGQRISVMYHGLYKGNTYGVMVIRILVAS